MKKTVIALAIAALAAAGTSSAATVYNQDGTKVDLSGSFRIFLGKVGENQRGDLINDGSRIKVNASHALDNGLSAFVGYETRFNGDQKSNQTGSTTGFGNITTNKLFVGFGFENVGKLSFGRQATTADDVLGDSLYYRSGKYNILTGSADKSIKFRSADFAGFSFGADYLFGHAKKDAEGYKSGYGVSAFYNYDFAENHKVDVAAGYTVDQFDAGSTETNQKNHNWVLATHYQLNDFYFGAAYGQGVEKYRSAESQNRTKYIFVESKYDLNGLTGIPSTVGLQWERLSTKYDSDIPEFLDAAKTQPNPSYGVNKNKTVKNQYIAVVDYKLNKYVVPYVQYTRATAKDNLGQRTNENIYGAGLRVHF